MRYADVVCRFGLVLLGYVIAVGLLHSRSSEPPSSPRGGSLVNDGGESAAVAARMKSVVERMAALEPALNRDSRDNKHTATLDCCTLARRHGVVPNEKWGTLPPDLQQWWNSHSCNKEIADGGCHDAAVREGNSRVRELEQLLNQSRTREAKLASQLHRALHPNERKGLVRGRRGVVMSCPHQKFVSHNAGPWKPRDPFMGVKAVANQLIALNSSLELVFVWFPGDGAEAACSELKKSTTDRLKVTCYAAPDELPEGYGLAKVTAMILAPLDEAIWLDCDTFPMRDLTPLLDEPTYIRTGAMFWPDVEDHFDDSKLGSIFEREKIDVSMLKLPLDSWEMKQGFDSGIFVIDKRRCTGVLGRLEGMAAVFQDKWKSYTSGDKDLWHLAWILHGQEFAYVPFAGSIGAFCEQDRRFCMTSQAKFDMSGEIVLTHQLWRDGRLPKPNFHDAEWAALTPQFGGKVRYNPPDLTIRFDLRMHGGKYRYARWNEKYPQHLRNAENNAMTDWDFITSDPNFGPDNMYATSNYIRMEIAKLAISWQY